MAARNRSVRITTKTAEFHVYLDQMGDHIVTRHTPDPQGGFFSVMLPYNSDAFDLAVRRAQHAVGFAP